MSVAQALYLAAAVPCFLTAGMLLHWARPVNGKLSPRLHRNGMETLVTGLTTLAALLGLTFVIGAALGALM
jgi:hypothetical protein